MTVAAKRQEVKGAADLGELFPKQAAFVFDDSPVTAAVTGRGGGKTYAGALKLLMYLVKHPGALAMVTAPNYPELNDATVKAILALWPAALIKHVTLAPGAGRLELVNGSEVLLRSTDHPDSLRGFDLCCAWMDEAALSAEKAFDVLLPAVRKPGYPHRIWLTTTPKGYNWLYKAFVRPGLRGYSLHHWVSRDNKHLNEEDIVRQEEKLGPELSMQEIEGQFRMVSGHVQFDQGWASEQLDLARDVKPVRDDGEVRVRLWAPYDRTHEYILGIDPKGGGEDKGYGMLLDWTFGVFMGEIRSTNKQPIVLREACIDLARAYSPRAMDGQAHREDQGCLCVPEYNGVGVEFPSEMRKAGCRVYRRPARPGEDRDGESFRRRDYGWWTDSDTRALMLSSQQRLIRQRRLASPNGDYWEAALSWDPEDRDHLFDILSAAGVATGAGTLLWGEMGSTVAQADRHGILGARALHALGHGRRLARPFVDSLR